MNDYRVATSIYRQLKNTTNLKNRRVKITAIKRTLEKLGKDLDNGVVYSREDLSPLPRAILTYSNITKFSDNDLRILDDLQNYLNGEVGV